MKDHDRLLAWALALVTYEVLQSRPSSSSLSSPTSLHRPNTPTPRSDRREGLHMASHINLQLEMFASLHDKECVRTVQLTGTCMHVFDFVGAYSWCWPTLHRFLCVFQGVVPLTLCQQQLLSIVPGGSSVSRPLIRIYKAHTSHRETPQSHTDLKPLTSAYIHLWQHITATTGKKTKNLLIRRYF